MDSVVIGGNNLALDVANTAYNCMSGESPWGTNETYMYQVISAPGTISTLKIELSAAPGVGTFYTFMLRKNGGNTTLTLIIADAATSGEDITHSVAVIEGDYIDLRCIPTGPPGAAYARWAWKFTSTNAKESNILGVAASDSKTLARYFSPSSSYRYYGSSNTMYHICPTAGKVRDLIVLLSNTPGAPGSYTLALYLNGVVTDLVASIASGNTTGSNTADEIAVVAGDRLEMKFTPVATPTNVITTTCWGMTFVATTDKEAPILGGGDQSSSNAGTRYNFPHDATGSPWDADEIDRHQLTLAQTLKKLYIQIDAAPGAGHNWTFTVYKNGNPTALTLIIADLAVSGNDITHSVAVVDGDELSLQAVPSVSAPHTTAQTHWGLVGYTGIAATGNPSWQSGAVRMLVGGR